MGVPKQFYWQGNDINPAGWYTCKRLAEIAGINRRTMYKRLRDSLGVDDAVRGRYRKRGPKRKNGSKQSDPELPELRPEDISLRSMQKLALNILKEARKNRNRDVDAGRFLQDREAIGTWLSVFSSEGKRVIEYEMGLELNVDPEEPVVGLREEVLTELDSGVEFR